MDKRYDTYTEDSTDYPQATGATRGGQSFRRWHTCDVCRLDYPEDQIVMFRGKAYCTSGCSDDIASILKIERAQYRARQVEETDQDGFTTEV